MKFDYTKIKYLETSHGLSERAMARRIGMSAPGYNKMMLKKSCTVETLVSIAKAFNMSIDYFFTSDEIAHQILEEPNQKYTATTPPNESCDNPYCLKRIKELEEYNQVLLDYNRTLKDQMQNGGLHNGKPLKGGLEKSEAS